MRRPRAVASQFNLTRCLGLPQLATQSTKANTLRERMSQCNLPHALTTLCTLKGKMSEKRKFKLSPSDLTITLHTDPHIKQISILRNTDSLQGVIIAILMVYIEVNLRQTDHDRDIQEAIAASLPIRQLHRPQIIMAFKHK